jgi:hypothetical protein
MVVGLASTPGVSNHGAPWSAAAPSHSPGRSTTAPCPICTKATMSPGQSAGDAKLHRRARRNGGRRSPGSKKQRAAPLRSPPHCAPWPVLAVPCPVRSKVVVSLGLSADDTKLHRRARRNGGQLCSSRHTRWLPHLCGRSLHATHNL